MRRQFLLRRKRHRRRLAAENRSANSGAFPGYTFRRRPVILVWSERFDRITDGIAAERQIKGWSRAKKEALIKQDWLEISRLSRRGGKSKPR
jgi:putative endonuclease